MKRLIIVFVAALFVAACGNNAEQGETLVEKIDRLESKQDTSLTERERVSQLAEAYLMFADSLPQSDSAAEFLYRAGNYTAKLGDFKGAISLLERLTKQYKKDEKRPEALWAIAAIYETSLNNYGKATEFYQRVIDEHPDHKLAKDAESAIKFVGREPTAEEIEEIIKQAEQSNLDAPTRVQ